MLWRPPRRSWCMHRILCTACNRNSTRSFERGHDGNILEEAYRGRYARQRLLNFWPESSCGYHAIKRFVCIIQVVPIRIRGTTAASAERVLQASSTTPSRSRVFGMKWSDTQAVSHPVDSRCCQNSNTPGHVCPIKLVNTPKRIYMAWDLVGSCRGST